MKIEALTEYHISFEEDEHILIRRCANLFDDIIFYMDKYNTNTLEGKHILSGGRNVFSIEEIEKIKDMLYDYVDTEFDKIY